MPRVTFQPDGKTVSVREGTTLLAASRQAGVTIRTRCNGVMGCMMCKVRVEPAEGVSLMSLAERRKLGEDAGDSHRFSCQAKAVRDCTVIVPEDPLKAAVRRQLERQKEEEELW